MNFNLKVKSETGSKSAVFVHAWFYHFLTKLLKSYLGTSLLWLRSAWVKSEREIFWVTFERNHSGLEIFHIYHFSTNYPSQQLPSSRTEALIFKTVEFHEIVLTSQSSTAALQRPLGGSKSRNIWCFYLMRLPISPRSWKDPNEPAIKAAPSAANHLYGFNPKQILQLLCDSLLYA